ncbi:MAG: hypothetical protein AAF414_05490 [Pseudomonadota bacterium]
MTVTRYAPWKGIALTLAPLLPASLLFGPTAGQAVAFAGAGLAMFWAASARV